MDISFLGNASGRKSRNLISDRGDSCFVWKICNYDPKHSNNRQKRKHCRICWKSTVAFETSKFLGYMETIIFFPTSFSWNSIWNTADNSEKLLRLPEPRGKDNSINKRKITSMISSGNERTLGNYQNREVSVNDTPTVCTQSSIRMWKKKNECPSRRVCTVWTCCGTRWVCATPRVYGISYVIACSWRSNRDEKSRCNCLCEEVGAESIKTTAHDFSRQSWLDDISRKQSVRTVYRAQV